MKIYAVIKTRDSVDNQDRNIANALRLGRIYLNKEDAEAKMFQLNSEAVRRLREEAAENITPYASDSTVMQYQKKLVMARTAYMVQVFHQDEPSIDRDIAMFTLERDYDDFRKAINQSIDDLTMGERGRD